MGNNNNLGALLPINESNGYQAVNARDLHVFLEVGRDFSNWMKDQIEKCDLVENQDYEVFAEKGENPKGGRPSKEYALSISAAKEISMMSQTEKGKQARRYFIACEDKLKTIAKNPTPNNLFSVQEQFQVIELASSTLKMTKSDKESMVSQVLSQYGLTLPVQNKEGAYILSADQLLKHHGIRLSTIAFNRLMQQHGYIEYRVRNTSKTKSGKSSYAALSPKGEKWGQNKDSKYCENKQDIFYYVKTFPQLLQELNLA